MGHDIYCAICGGPLRDVRISHEPRTEAFKAAVAKGEEPPPRRREGKSPPYQRDEKDTYDPDIITEEAAQWTTNIALLGFNPSAKGHDQGFVTAEGYYDGYGQVCVTHCGPERNEGYIEGRGNTFPCYDTFEDDDVAFPFHPSCYTVFRRRLAHRLGEDGRVNVNKGLLYSVFRALPHDHYCLNIDYGSPSPDCHDQGWSSNAGEEIFAADPGPVDGLEERITDLIAEDFFSHRLATELDLSHKVREDPFKTLPHDILLRIGKAFDDVDSFYSWMKASWFAHAQLRGAGSSFWKDALWTQMDGWFLELRPCLDDEGLRKGSSMRALYLWAACFSKPQLWMKGGDFLCLANRRRIWTTPCAELVEHYCRAVFARGAGGADGSDFQQLLRNKAACGNMYTVTHDRDAQLFGQVEKCFWVDEWEDTYTKSQLVEAFFRQKDGWLVGIAVATEEGERRVLGSSNRKVDGELLVFEATVPADDWICGLLLHIPSLLEVVGTASSHGKTSVKGITINCKSGLDLHLGETNKGYPVRPLMARAGRQIVGMVVQNGVGSKPRSTGYSPERPQAPLPGVEGTPFTRIGLITLWDTQLEDRTILPDNVARLRWDEMTIDDVLWQDDGKRYFDVPYWNNPSLRFLEHYELTNVCWGRREVDMHLAAHEVLL